MTFACPCCGAAMERPFLIDAETATVTTPSGTAQLSAGRMLPMLKLLERKFPGLVREEALGLAAFGNSYWNLSPNNISVHISLARRALRSVGLEIIGRKGCGGYRIAVMKGAAKS